jgi:hypothetical protein
MTRAGTVLTWTHVQTGQTLPDFASETDVARYSTAVLTDVAAAVLPLLARDEKLSFVSELSIFGDRADLWVLRRRGVPVGVVEVKKPGGKKQPLDSTVVAGQIFDYMCRLREFHGLNHVFGIVTTYREWRVFWLRDCDEAALGTTLPSLDAVPPGASPTATANAPSSSLLPDTPVWDDVSAATDVTVFAADAVEPEASPAKERMVRAGRILMWDDPTLIDTLASVLLKMASSPATSLKRLIDPKRRYIQVKPDQWLWSKLPPNKTINLHTWPMAASTAAAATFLLLHHLGDGTYGRVWLACSMNGAACVLKFPKLRSDGSDADFDQEVAIWRDVWGVPDVCVLMLAGKETLVMPYVTICSGEIDAQSVETKEAAREAARRMAACGWQHDDLHWSHVGLYTQGGQRKAVFIDVGIASRIAAPHDSAAATAYMLGELGLD